MTDEAAPPRYIEQVQTGTDTTDSFLPLIEGLRAR